MDAGSKSKNTVKIIIPVIFAAVLIIAAVTAVVALSSASKDSYRVIKVNSFEGSVTVQRSDNGTLDAFDGMQLISQDNVQVGQESFLELLADSDKHIAAEENTGFVLKSSGTSDSGNITIELLYGKALFTIDNKLNENSSFKVTTPNAVMSVRGTRFSVWYDVTTGQTVIEVFEGIVEAEYFGKTELVEQGGQLVISNSASEAQSESQTYSENSSTVNSEEISLADTERYEIQMIFSRYYTSTAEYKTAAPLEYDLYVGSEPNESASIVTANMPQELSKLQTSTLKIGEEVIEPVMKKVNAYAEAHTEDILNQYKNGVFDPPLDITYMFDDSINRTITLNCENEDITFDFAKVEITWNYSKMSINQVSYSDYPLTIVDGDTIYGIAGVTFTFFIKI